MGTNSSYVNGKETISNVNNFHLEACHIVSSTHMYSRRAVLQKPLPDMQEIKWFLVESKTILLALENPFSYCCKY